jgi:hypothetical protein
MIINFVLMRPGIVTSPIGFLTNPYWAKFVITWRWTRYKAKPRHARSWALQRVTRPTTAC